MFKILIIEDDKEIRDELKILLKNNGYDVETIENFENVDKKILSIEPHIVLLDVNLPKKNGYEICGQVRAKSKVPIIFVTSRNNSMDELNGIIMGGDDYIEKPYNIPILLARIKSLLNRVYQNEEKESKLEYKEIILDILKSTVSHGGKTVELTKTEVKTLYYLFKNKNKISERPDIINYI